MITSIGGYPGGGTGFRANSASFAPGVAAQYCNGSKRPPEAICKDANTGATIPCGYSVPPGTNESNVPNPIFSLTAGATVDEANNWVSISWGPLAMTNPLTNAQLGDYSLAPGSQAINYITPGNSSTTYTAAPPNDFFDRPRKSNNAVDAGAVEFQAAAVAVPTLTLIAPTSGARGTAVPVTLTGTNLTGATAVNVSGTGVTVSGITATSTTVTATFTITGSATLSARTVSVTTPGGTSNTVTFTVVAGIPALSPTTRNFGTVIRNCPGTTPAQILACSLDPIQIFTLTNNGSVPLTGIAQGALGGVNASEFSIVRLLSTCGPVGGGQLAGQTTLAPGAACVVTVQFRPLTTQTTGVKNATVSVTDLAGTQISTLTGNANP